MTSAPAPAGRVLIEYGSGLFTVTVEPSDPIYPNRSFPTHRGARGHAGGIRLVRGLPIVDRTCPLIEHHRQVKT